MLVTGYETIASSKKVSIFLDSHIHIIMYYGDARKLELKEGIEISEETYQHLLHEILGKRATKRAMHLLERMERTEHQLREKLRQNDYPAESIEDAISYVKSYHYLDDERYSRTYIRYHQEERSRQRLKMELQRKGISKDTVVQALDEEYISDERKQIAELLHKKRFPQIPGDAGEFRRIYQFLLRRGFRSHDIYAEMKKVGENPYEDSLSD